MQRLRRLVRFEFLARGLLVAASALSAQPVSGQAAVGSPTEGATPSAARPSGGFAIVDGPSGPELEAIPLAEGEVVVLATGGDDGTIGVLLPPTAPGMSGDLWKAGAGQRFVLRRAGGELSVSLATAGEPRLIASASFESLAAFDLVVSLVGADGTGRVWTLSGWAEVEREEIAPPLDLFTGKVPLSAGDHVLTVAAERRFEGEPVVGYAPLRLVGRHFVADVSTPDGSRVPLLVDTAAVTSVITPQLLPDGVKPERSGMVEQSAQGRRVLDSVLMGATGEAGGLLGDVVLPALDVGGLHFENVHATVIESLPRLGDEPVAGILGSDLLGRAPVLVIEPPRGGAPGRIELATRVPASERGDGDIVVPITRANGLTWLRARAGDADLHLVLDTGAAATVLLPKSAERAGAASSEAQVELHGLSGSGAARHAKLPTLHLGDREVGPLSILVSDIAVLQRVAVGRACGVLGLPELEGAARIVLDLERRELRLHAAAK